MIGEEQCPVIDVRLTETCNRDHNGVSVRLNVNVGAGSRVAWPLEIRTPIAQQCAPCIKGTATDHPTNSQSDVPTPLRHSPHLSHTAKHHGVFREKCNGFHSAPVVRPVQR